MDAPNPYRPPAIPGDLASQAKSLTPIEDSIGFAFQADWSTQGLRERRRSPHHLWGDVTFFVLVFGWVVSAIATILMSAGAGLVCLLTPLVFMTSVLWLSNWAYRRGGKFHVNGAPLAGEIRGRVDDGVISFRGPAMSLATPVARCQHSKWTTSGAVFRPPLVPELLPIADSDIGDTWGTTIADAANPDRLVARTLAESDQGSSHVASIEGEGTLLGADFRRHSRWFLWNRVGPALAATGGILMIVCVLAWLTLPSWVRHPPSHYARSEAEQRTIWYLAMAFVFSALLTGFGFWLWSRCKASFGHYRVVFTPDTVVIAGAIFAAGYFGKSLSNFSVGEAGLEIHQPNGQLTFVIPFRWFEPDDRQRIESWMHGHPEAGEPPLMRFLGPEF